MSQALFNTPEAAINACNVECERAWSEYVTTQRLDLAKAPPNAVAAAQQVFRAGYFAGAKWVSESIVKQMMSKQPQQ